MSSINFACRIRQQFFKIPVFITPWEQSWTPHPGEIIAWSNRDPAINEDISHRNGKWEFDVMPRPVVGDMGQKVPRVFGWVCILNKYLSCFEICIKKSKVCWKIWVDKAGFPSNKHSQTNFLERKLVVWRSYDASRYILIEVMFHSTSQCSNYSKTTDLPYLRLLTYVDCA